MNNANLHVAVVGGGPGGYAAAFLAADLGLKVTLIGEDTNPGGVCLYRGCIPSKALLHAAKLIGEAHQAANWGIEFGAPRLNLDKLRSWKRERRQKTDRRVGTVGEAALRRLCAGPRRIRQLEHAENLPQRRS